MTEEEKESEPILEHADGTLVKIITTWKKYPLDQWMHEQILGRISQSYFKPPEKDTCGGTFHRILLVNEGWVWQCDKCGTLMPDASHQVFWTDHEQILHLV